MKIIISLSLISFPFLVSGCIGPGFATGLASGLSGNPPRSTYQSTMYDYPDLLEDYDRHQARLANQAILREQRNRNMCRRDPTLPLC